MSNPNEIINKMIKDLSGVIREFYGHDITRNDMIVAWLDRYACEIQYTRKSDNKVSYIHCGAAKLSEWIYQKAKEEEHERVSRKLG